MTRPFRRSVLPSAVPAIAAIAAIIAFGAAGCSVTSKPADVPTAAQQAATLRLPLTTEPTTLDPANVPDLNTIEMIEECFEGLVRYDENNKVAPCLAESWDVSPDRLTYTFHLRKHVTFHNGAPMTAEDVKYSWERALSPTTASPVAANYLDGILGLKDVATGKRTELAGVIVRDPLTLDVHIDWPRAYFLGMLSYPTGFVVCKSQIQAHGGVVNKDAYAGTGPFSLTSYRPGVSVILSANKHYWGGAPKLDRIEMPVMINPQTVYDNFTTGRIDMWTSQIPTSRYAQDRNAGKLTAEYHVLPLAEFDYLAMQEAKQPLFAKKAVRQAIGLAIDRDRILKIAVNGVGRVADGILSPEMPLRGPTPPRMAYAPEKARRLLASAGYPGGAGIPPVTLCIVQKTPDATAAAELIRDNLRDNLGITVNVQEREAGQFFKDEQKGGMEMYYISWIADYPDPQDFLSTLFVSHAGLNRTGYSNPRFDALCASADSEADPAKRAALYGAANAILADDLPVIPTTFTPRVILVQKSITGWRYNTSDILPHTGTTRAH